MSTRLHTAWRPPHAAAAVCFSVDDVHPTAAAQGLAVGEIGRRALDHLDWLLARHPQLPVTLFITPDWRSLSVYPTRGWLPRLPVVRHAFYAADVLPRGTLRLDRHPEFVGHLRRLRGVDFGIHGLHHVRRGPSLVQEYHGRSRRRCRWMIAEARRIMAAAGLPVVGGLAPPGWTAPPVLLEVMAELAMLFVTSARDLDTTISPDALARQSGLRNVSLVYPQPLPYGRLVHISTNFQATSSIDRAMAILECGGLLAVKAHLLKRFGRYEALNGLDRPYVQYLDQLFARIEDRYGDRVWWTTLAAVASRMQHGLAASRGALV